MREITPLEDMTREELVDEVQLGLIVVGEHQADIDILKTKVAHLDDENTGLEAENAEPEAGMERFREYLPDPR